MQVPFLLLTSVALLKIAFTMTASSPTTAGNVAPNPASVLHMTNALMVSNLLIFFYDQLRTATRTPNSLTVLP